MKKDTSSFHRELFFHENTAQEGWMATMSLREHSRSSRKKMGTTGRNLL